MRLALALLLTSAAYSAQTVEGTIHNSVTGAGIPGAKVTLLRGKGGNKSSYQALSDGRGSFRVDGVEEGDYHAEFSATGFIAPQLNATVTVDVHVTTQTGLVDVTLVPAAKLSGKVLDANGNAVVSAQVSLTEVGGLSAQEATSGTDGTFQFGRVSPGTFQLDAVAPRGLKLPAAQKGEVLGWIRTYYPSVTDRAFAANITVGAGWQLPGQDIRLLAVPLHFIRGNVFDAGGAPAPRAALKLVLDNDIHAREIPFTALADGSFVSPALHEGGWRLSAVSEHAGTKAKDFKWIRLGNRDIERVDLHLEEPFSVGARVDLPDTLANSEGCLILAPDEGGSGDEIGSACGGAQEFTIPNMYRRPYRIEPMYPPGDFYLASITIGERDVMGQTVELGPGSLPIRIAYKSNGGMLRGTVEACNGATVVAMPQEPELRISNYYRLIRRASCGGDGSFQISNMRPGRYYVFAFADDHPGPNQFKTLSQDLMNAGVSAFLRAGETETVTVRVTHRSQ